MAVPRSVPEDADFGKPLASHDEVALVTVACDREWELVVEGEVKGDGFVGRERTRKDDLGDGVVLRGCRRRAR